MLVITRGYFMFETHPLGPWVPWVPFAKAWAVTPRPCRSFRVVWVPWAWSPLPSWSRPRGGTGRPRAEVAKHIPSRLVEQPWSQTCVKAPSKPWFLEDVVVGGKDEWYEWCKPGWSLGPWPIWEDCWDGDGVYLRWVPREGTDIPPLIWATISIPSLRLLMNA